jgi:hypothetical protein
VGTLPLDADQETEREREEEGPRDLEHGPIMDQV